MPQQRLSEDNIKGTFMEATLYDFLEDLRHKARRRRDFVTAGIINCLFNDGNHLMHATRALKAIRALPCPSLGDRWESVCQEPDCPRCIAVKALEEIGQA
jgi:hypothetical protein